jgi:hypothetical protein
MGVLAHTVIFITFNDLPISLIARQMIAAYAAPPADGPGAYNKRISYILR